jgi:metal-responsive CopG/Arc/MetJ family transcriptional regulator
LKSVNEKDADHLTSFRLPRALLRTVDLFCEQQDVTRSQFFRRCIAEYVADHQASIHWPEKAGERVSVLAGDVSSQKRSAAEYKDSLHCRMAQAAIPK